MFRRLSMALGLLVSVCGLGSVSGPAPAVSAVGPIPAPQLINPARLMDSRSGGATVDTEFSGGGPFAAGSVVSLKVAGRAGIPADASAVTLNVTAVKPSTAGFLTVYPCGTTRPLTSSINYDGGDIVPNAVLAKIGSNGQICIFTLQKSDILVDVNGFVPAGGSPFTIEPARLMDSRSGGPTIDQQASGGGPFTAGSFTRLTVTGRAGIPANASAVMLNVTAVKPSEKGFLTVYPCGSAQPGTSSVNYEGGDIVPNAVLAKVGTDGQVCIYTLHKSDIVVDVTGYVPLGASPNTVVPARLLDSRTGQPTVDALDSGGGPFAAGSITKLTVTNRAGVSADASAVILNVTAVRPAAPGYLTVFPCGEPQPGTSSVNYNGGDIVPNAVFTKVGADGQVCIFSLAASDIVVDVNGFVPAPLTPCTIKGTTVETAVSGIECDALIALYTNAGGPSWTNGLGWNTSTDPCTWYGVVCTNGVITEIDLSNNELRGSIPAALGGMAHLQVLRLDVNALSGPIPPELGKVVTLETVMLNNNALDGTIPAELAKLTNLTTLSLYNNALTGTIPVGLGALTRLSSLRLNGNELTGKVPAELGAIKTLNNLWLNDNALDGAIPTELGTLGALTELRLGNNAFTGTIPTSLGDLLKLQTLTLDHNALTESVPVELGKLTALQVLDVSDNRLTGAPPAEIGNLSQLRSLRMSYNKLTGPIPARWGTLAQLVELRLNNNSISGAIPTQIGNLVNLGTLTLANNRLTGQLPGQLGNLEALQTLDLSNNQLTGDVTPALLPLMTSEVYWRLILLQGNGCLETTNATLGRWLTAKDMSWNSTCPNTSGSTTTTSTSVASATASTTTTTTTTGR